MSLKKKFVRVLAVFEILIAATAVLTPWLVFPVCESTLHHCHYSFIAEIGISSVAAVAGAMTALSKGAEAPRSLSVVSAVCGVFMILYPSAIIGVCDTSMMACHYGDLPVWNLLGGLLIIFSIAIFFASKEEADS